MVPALKRLPIAGKTRKKVSIRKSVTKVSESQDSESQDSHVLIQNMTVLIYFLKKKGWDLPGVNRTNRW